MTLTTDVRLALRSLRRRRVFAAMSVAILALGIGANSAMFSVVDAVLLRSLPYRDADRLVAVFGDGSARGQGPRVGATAGDFLDWREQTKAFSGLVALRNESRRLTSVDTPLVPLVHAVTADYFEVLGTRFEVGRGFAPGEDEPGRDGVAVLSYGLWQSVFGGDPGIVGRSVELDQRPHTIVGVAARDFYTANAIAVQPGLWVPTPLASLRGERLTRDLVVFGRLAPGRSLAEAGAELKAIAAGIAERHPDTSDRWSVAVQPLRERVVGNFSRMGAILLAGVSLVLLIACANVANLTLARATERVQEVALRSALGASRGRLVVQLLTESVLLSSIGGVLGVGIAAFGAGPLARLIPAQAGVPFLDRVAVDARVLGFTLVVSVVCGVLFGLAPVRHALRVDIVDALREGGRGRIGGANRRLREALVVAEVALAVVIVSAAGLMLRSLAGLQGVPPGFDAPRILKLRTSLRGDEFRTPAARSAHYEELQRRLAAIPGVASVSAVSFEPPPIVDGGFGSVRLAFPELPADAASQPSAILRAAMPGYFETMGIPILAGRGIREDDLESGRRVAVISASLARRYFEGRDPLGRSFGVHGPMPRPMEVVGVVGDVMSAGSETAPYPTFYLPHTQSSFPAMSFVLRVERQDPGALSHEAERAAWSFPGSINVYAVETMENRLRDLNWRTRLGAGLLSGFAALALALGAAGIYAVVSYTVALRRGEIALRMALGARARDVLAMVLGGGLRLTALGLAAGAIASLLLTRALEGLLFGVAPGDPRTLAAVAGLLLLVATLACLAPALRAARTDPQAALRD